MENHNEHRLRMFASRKRIPNDKVSQKFINQNRLLEMHPKEKTKRQFYEKMKRIYWMEEVGIIFTGVRLPSKARGNASRVILALVALTVFWFLTKG